jgi:hypothetical protein
MPNSHEFGYRLQNKELPMYRFTIRDMLWLTVVAALAVSWWVDLERIDTTLARLEQERAKVEQDRQLLQADFDDRLIVLDQLQRKASEKYSRSVVP